MELAIGTPIGYQSNAAKAVGTFEYFLYDDFTSDLLAGQVNGTKAEPGPGVRSVADTGNNLSLSGGNLVTIGTVSGANPALRWQVIRRALGQMAFFNLRPGAGVAYTVRVGWSSPTNHAGVDSLIFNNNNALIPVIAGTIGANIGIWEDNTDYAVLLIQRTSGYYWFLKGGAFTYWTLLWHLENGTTSLRCPVVSQAGTGGTPYTIRKVYIPVEKWVPSPIVSDGFSNWGVSDGLGHQEGIEAGIGSGGAAKSWTSVVGSWGATAGVANATALTGGRAIATIDCGKADIVISCNMTVPANTFSICVRWVDENNFIMLRRTTTNLQLVKVVAGTPTTVSDVGVTYVAGAPVRLICSGTKFQMFYNSANVSTEQTISDAVLQASTIVGLRSDNISCTADNFIVLSRGTNNEYSILDTF